MAWQPCFLGRIEELGLAAALGRIEDLGLAACLLHMNESIEKEKGKICRDHLNKIEIYPSKKSNKHLDSEAMGRSAQGSSAQGSSAGEE